MAKKKMNIQTFINYGLYLSVLLFLRIGHPPLFIPWGDIMASDFPRGLIQRVELRFKRLPGVPVIVSRALAEHLAKESNGALIIQDKPVQRI